MNQRLQQLTKWMKQSSIEGAFITSTENVFYLSGFYIEPHERLVGLAVFPDNEPFLICPSMEVPEAKKAGWSGEVIGYTDTDRPWDFIEKQVKSRIPNIHSWAIEKEHLNVERYEEMVNRFTGARFVSAEEKLQELRMVKDASEMQKLRKAAEIADFAIQTGVNAIAEGVTEQEIIAAIEYEVKKKGISQMSFSTTVLAGANAASPHGNPGQTKIKKGDFVLFDLGVVYEGYCSDITRTVAFGEISPEQEKIYQTVLDAEETAIKAVKPGVLASELDLTARKIIEDAGYGSYFPHRLGHGLGISVHEYPSLTETNNLAIREGMVFTIEPGIYMQNVAGVRIEDDVYVTKDGVEVLTKFPKSLQIIKP